MKIAVPRQQVIRIPSTRGAKGSAGQQGLRGIDGFNGLDGRNGIDGKSGLNGKPGLNGLDGRHGLDGLNGRDGFTPDHRWEGEPLQFKNPDGTWGKKVNLRGNGFIGASSPTGVNYIAVRAATYTVRPRDLEDGENIFGVNYAGAVTIKIPKNISTKQLITIKDESCSAGTNNITIETL